MHSTNKSKAPTFRAAVFFVAVGAVQLTAAAQPSSGGNEAMTDSVVTVDSLLRIENSLALEKARRDAIGAGLLRPAETKVASAKPAAMPPATLLVSSIFGADGVLRATVTYNGAFFEGVRVGAPIGKCSVVAITSSTVYLAPSKGAPTSQCPNGVWTGESAQAAAFTSSFTPAVVGAAVPLPNGPLPAGLSSAAGLQQAASAPGTRKFEPAVDMRAPALSPGQLNSAAAN